MWKLNIDSEYSTCKAFPRAQWHWFRSRGDAKADKEKGFGSPLTDLMEHWIPNHESFTVIIQLVLWTKHHYSMIWLWNMRMPVSAQLWRLFDLPSYSSLKQHQTCLARYKESKGETGVLSWTLPNEFNLRLRDPGWLQFRPAGAARCLLYTQGLTQCEEMLWHVTAVWRWRAKPWHECFTLKLPNVCLAVRSCVMKSQSWKQVHQVVHDVWLPAWERV